SKNQRVVKVQIIPELFMNQWAELVLNDAPGKEIGLAAFEFPRARSSQKKAILPRAFVQDALDGVQKARYALNLVHENRRRLRTKNDLFDQVRLGGVVQKCLFESQVDRKVRPQCLYKSRFSG